MPATLLYAEHLFDGERALGDAGVLIDGGRVRWVGPRSRLPAEASGATEAQAPAGTTVTPGLVNCHIHLTLAAGVDIDAETRAPEATLALRAAANALRSLTAGVTTVRDLGAPSFAAIELGNAIARGELVGPNIVAAGRGITPTGGHGWQIGRQADGPDEVRRAVREQIFAGASVIKIFSTGGLLGTGAHPDIAQFTLDETRAAVDEAHARGLRITTHVHATAGAKIAIEAGVDSIEHATLLDADAIRLCREKRIALVPTFAAIKAILANADKLGPGIGERARALAERQQQGLRDAIRSGVTVATGADSGTAFNYAERYAVELESLVEVGMSAERAVMAATSVAADVIGRDDVGRIRAGARADLVAFRGDPLSDIRACWDVAAVWKDGVRLQGTSAGPRHA
jgi:imidazolonepropionase-like amidohydrolase